MGSRLEGGRGVFGRLLDRMRLHPTAETRVRALRENLLQERRNAADQLESLKRDIRQSETQVLKKQAEFDSASGDLKTIVRREIEGLFRNIDRMKTRASIIARQIENISATLGKVEERVLADSAKSSVTEESLDELAVELEEAYAELQVNDRAVRELESVTFDASKLEPLDVDSRLAELAREKPAATVRHTSEKDSSKTPLSELEEEE